MAKYIIEFEDEPSMVEAGLRYYQCKQVPYWGVSHGIIKNLAPYTEPDRESIENEVWDFVRCVHKMNGDDYHECFDIDDVSDEDYCTKYSYQEAKAKYDAWKKSKEEIHVGDEVFFKGDPHKEKAIVLRLYQPKLHKPISDVLWADGSVETKVLVEKLMRTDRHFDEVEKLLERMKAE